MITLLYLIRHGETSWTLSGQHTGTTDLPLTTNGELQAGNLGKLLKRYSFDSVFTSPLKRAKQTCHLAGFSEQAIVDPDLIEWNYGDYEGKTSLEIQQLNPDWELFHDGAPKGESISSISARADRFLNKIRELKGHIAIFSSGHILRVLIARWLHLPATQGRLFFLHTGSLTILGYEHSKPVLVAPSLD
ncbi:MAG: histidine phosphatase family protein [Simkania sp.]|nr:histidine phosphatase family protein [Simkania sp.]